MLFEKDLEVFAVKITDSIDVCLEKLTTSSIKFCCVTDNLGFLLGVVSYGDILKGLDACGRFGSVNIAGLMNRNFGSASYGNDHSSLKVLLSRYRFVPLIDELKRLQGIVYGSSNNREFRIAEHSIRNETDYILIAEIGNNHNGSLDMAYRLIDAAKESGAHIAKFQMRDLKSLYGGTSKSEDLSTEYVINLLNKVSLSTEDMYRCFDYCQKAGITPLCTPFDLTSLENLEKWGVEGYKIASADLTNTLLYQAILDTGKPVIASTGMSTDEEIDSALNLLEISNSNFAVCHTNSTYPAPYVDINLNYLNNLKGRTHSVLGYSGHERGWHIPLAAFALGAQVIEKHFTLDTTMEGNDHKVSLLPAEFSSMAESIKDVAMARGDGPRRRVSQGEANNRVALAKSIFCARPVNKGDIIEEEDLEVRSPGNGLSPRFLQQLIGKKAIRELKEGEPLYSDDLAGRKAGSDSRFPKQFAWSIPVRHRDVYKLYGLFAAPSIEFHLSFKDLELNDEDILTQNLNTEVIVHAPEQFDNDFIIDLFSADEATATHSVELLNRVFAKAANIARLVSGQEKVKVVVNCGGQSQQSFQDKNKIKEQMRVFRKNLSMLTPHNCVILAQTMPPFPWHFGGQSFHNQFTSASNIQDILSVIETNIELCLDISHSFMWCNHSGEDFYEFVASIIEYVSHIHISDAGGVASEGLQIGKGEVDFSKLRDVLIASNFKGTLLPEIWQGHENKGEGFRVALNRLNELGY
jgi:sialic acid synthase SpsE/sugar phosphate isomerase/epimerase